MAPGPILSFNNFGDFMLRDLFLALVAGVFLAIGALVSYQHYPFATACVLLALGMAGLTYHFIAGKREKKRISELPPPVVLSRAERKEKLGKIAARMKAARA